MEADIFKELPEFDHLIRSKPYKDLTETEKKLLGKFMRPDEYDYLHSLIASAEQEEIHMRQKITPDPAVKGKLMAGISVNPSPRMKPDRGGFALLLTYRIPLYQASIAASVLVIIILAFLLPVKIRTEKLAVADTVYREKLVRETDTVWLYREKPEQSTSSSARNRKASNAKQESKQAGLQYNRASTVQPGDYERRQMNEALARIVLLSSGRTGNSISEESNLMKLVSPLY